jgi:hypothetical protein
MLSNWKLNLMEYLKKLLITPACLVVLSITFPFNVHAYLDPGTGSYFLQLIIAGLLGSLFTVKLYWKKIKNFFITIFLKRKSIE